MSKKTTKVLNKEPFVRRLRVSAGRQTFIQVRSTHEPQASREVIYLIHFPPSLCLFLSHASSLIFLYGYSPPTLYVFWLIFSLINISLEETLLQVINMSFSGPFKDVTEGLDWGKKLEAIQVSANKPFCVCVGIYFASEKVFSVRQDSYFPIHLQYKSFSRFINLFFLLMLAFKCSLKQDKLITSLKLFVFYLQMIYYEAETTKTKQGKAPSVSI